MGLDMYLHKRTSVKNWEGQDSEHKYDVTVTRGGKETGIKKERIAEVVEEVCYWRKANAIHGWFVRVVQGGVDDCREHYVSREELADLVNACEMVIDSLEKSPKGKVKVRCGWDSKKGDIYEDVEVFTDTSVAERVLPTTEGFFFGGVDYTDYYLSELKRTKEVLESELRGGNGDYYYGSSW